MGVDLTAFSVSLPALLTLAFASAAVAWLLLRLAARFGTAFFVTGLLAGTLLYTLIATAVLSILARLRGEYPLAASGASVSLAFNGLMGLIGSWFACRSVLRRIRAGKPLVLRPGATLRTVGAFWGGLGFAVLAAVVVVYYTYLR